MSVPRLDVQLALKLGATLTRRHNAVPSRRGARLQLKPRPSAPDPTNLAAIRRWVHQVPRPSAIDLFSGAGGLSLGLVNAGFSVLVAADIDAFATETYVANLGGLAYTGDLSDPTDFIDHLKAWDITSVDLVAGGVPCQPFSRAGRSKIRSLVDAKLRPSSDGRADLWQSFIAIIRFLHPRAVVLENVPDLAEWNDGAVLVGLLESLREVGYQTDARILNAYEYGVPQYRSRLFITGISGSRMTWPISLTSRATVWDAISDLPVAAPGQRIEVLPYGGPSTKLQRRLRSGVPRTDRNLIYDHITRDVRPDDAEAFAGLPEGGTYLNVPSHLRRYRSDIFTDKYKRLSKDDLSRTITAHLARDGYWYIHPIQNRTLSVREAARIQTFPDWFRFAGEPSLRYRQIGNAVPPMLAEAVGRSVARALRTNATKRPADRNTFRHDLLTWSALSATGHPWRLSRDPWRVLVAEICVRRLRANEATAILDRFMALAPDPLSAQRNSDRLRIEFAALAPRIDALIAVASAMVERHDGKVPGNREQLNALPGVGDYLASSVLCFGFGHSSVVMNNVTQRIVSRLMGRDPARGLWQMRLDLHRLAGKEDARPEFNVALLALGDHVCSAVKPHCKVCPVSPHCASFGIET